MKFEYHVKPTGSDAACGDAEHPFATISKAAQVAAPGDTVIVHEGVYREQVDPKRGGLSEHERITYCGAEGDQRLGMRAGLDGIGRSSACVDGGA
jgi:alpha-N-arabinofuranosidase